MLAVSFHEKLPGKPRLKLFYQKWFLKMSRKKITEKIVCLFQQAFTSRAVLKAQKF